MKAGVKDFCAFLSTAALAMGAISSLSAIMTGSREMQLQAVIYGLIGLVAAVAILVRM